jgi:hypothetical protein
MTYYNSEEYTDEELEFSYDGDEYWWQGDIEVNEEGDNGDWETQGYSELEVSITYTHRLCIFNVENADWTTIKINDELKKVIKEEFAKRL